MCGPLGLPTLISLRLHRAADKKEPDMDNGNGNDTDTVQSPRYVTPTFDPRSAFSWTLRAGEIARLKARQQRNGRAGLTSAEFEQGSKRLGRV